MAQVVVELSADEAKLLQSYRKIQESQNKVDQGHKQTKKSHEDAFGSSAVSKLQNYVMGLVSVTAMVGTLNRALADIRSEADRSAQRQKEAQFGLGSLAQLAQSPQDMVRMVNEAKKTRQEGGAESLNAAGALQFALESAGVPEYRSGISLMRKAGVVNDAKALVDAASALGAAYGEATKSFEDVVSLGFGANVGAPAAVEELLTASGQAASMAQRAGLSQKELLAGVATIAKVEGAQTAGVQMKNLMGQLQGGAMKEGLVKRGSLSEIMGQLMAMEASGTNMMDLIPEIRAFSGYETLKKRWGTYNELLAEAEKGVTPNQYGANAFQRKTQFGKSIPELVGVDASNVSTANKELSLGVEGVYANLADAIETDVYTYQMKNQSKLTATLNKYAASTQRTLFGDEVFVSEAIGKGVGVSTRYALTENTLKALEDAAASLKAAAANMEDASEKQRYERAASVLSN